MIKQKDAVIEYLNEHGSITQRDATLALGVTRLAAVICQIKRDGIDIVSKNEQVKTRYGTTTISRYSYARRSDN